MHTAALVAVALLVLSVLAVILSVVAQRRAVRRTKPWLMRLLVFRNREEVSVLDATAWIAAHHLPTNHYVVAEGLRQLQAEGLAESRLQETDLPAERRGIPRSLYRVRQDPAVAEALQRMVDTCDRVEAGR